MALSIHINKLSEDNKFVYYEYGSVGRKFGRIKIAKNSGDTILIELAEGDGGVQARAASHALILHWKKGEYPNETYWAS